MINVSLGIYGNLNIDRKLHQKATEAIYILIVKSAG